ncbi:unnamed protein product, partial [Cladocopium goreaui]
MGRSSGSHTWLRMVPGSSRQLPCNLLRTLEVFPSSELTSLRSSGEAVYARLSLDPEALEEDEEGQWHLDVILGSDNDLYWQPPVPPGLSADAVPSVMVCLRSASGVSSLELRDDLCADWGEPRDPLGNLLSPESPAFRGVQVPQPAPKRGEALKPSLDFQLQVKDLALYAPSGPKALAIHVRPDQLSVAGSRLQLSLGHGHAMKFFQNFPSSKQFQAQPSRRLRGAMNTVRGIAAATAASPTARYVAIGILLGVSGVIYAMRRSGTLWILGLMLALLLEQSYFLHDWFLDLAPHLGCPPDVVWRRSLRRPLAALTIDDVPLLNSPSTLEAILDVLKENQVHATLMIMSGFDVAVEHGGASPELRKRYRELLKRAVTEGHELGNHLQFDRPAIAMAADDFDRA